jgi:FtsP/CotA-like multicopper oxidase with cupredoxin domain
MRLLIRSRPAVYGERPGYAYVLGGSAEEADPNTLRVPGPTLVLEKDQPVAITVVNQSHEPAAVHWHGIELESYPDGVPGFSGAGDHLLRAIAVGDSLTVRFTPPRAGTFMYHSHFNEQQQISSGLYGAIIVLERGQRYDPAFDRLMILSDADPAGSRAGSGAFMNALLNGQAEPQPIALSAGRTHRLRIINIRSDFLTALEWTDGDRIAEWRHVAKDGADLPPSQATLRPAYLVLGPGEIHDVEFTPRVAGEMRLRYGFPLVLRPIPGVPTPRLPPAAVMGVQVR